MRDIIEFAITRHLPDRMLSDEAVTMMLAIGYQESRFEHRRQIRGPARGFWQFEHGGGVVGVLEHPATSVYAQDLCDDLCYARNSNDIYQAIADNDILAACFARLLLWTLPIGLPEVGDEDEAWRQYIEAWRPGKPHRKTWSDSYQYAVMGLA